MSDNDRTTITSRRQFLVQLGVLGTGMSLACSVGALLGVRWARRNQQYEEMVIPMDGNTSFISRATWGAKSSNHQARNEYGFHSPTNPYGWLRYEAPLQERYHTIVMHHSAMYSRNDVETVRDIQELHQGKNGWADVGYHYIIGKEGGIYEGRIIWARGAHVGGFNTGSLGICLLGNFMQEQPTTAQLEATRELLVWVTNTLQPTHIATHKVFTQDTVCPGTHVSSLMDEFAALTGLQRGTEGYVFLP